MTLRRPSLNSSSIAAPSNSLEDADDALADPARQLVRGIVGVQRGDDALGVDGGQADEELVEPVRDGGQLVLLGRPVEVEQHLLEGALAEDEDQAREPVADR